jgi:hypothetical protein
VSIPLPLIEPLAVTEHWSRFAVAGSQVGRAGIEPATLGLKVPCSTN